MTPVATSRRPHKYGAKPKTVAGIRFASQKEAGRYQELLLLEKAGQIRDLRLQPEFPLCPWMMDHSDIRVIGKYRGDFAYEELGGVSWDEPPHRVIVEDVKGYDTPLSKWKRRHAEFQYGITIRIV